MREVASILLIALAAYAGLCAWLYATQRSQMYFPTPDRQRPDLAPLWIESGGERIKVWTVRRESSRATIYFGGNAEDVALSVDELAAALPGSAMYFVNYRGYGGSSGRPTEAALNADALAVYDELSKRHAAFDVVGRSLGSAVATYLASERPVRRLVLVTPFDSLAAVAQDHFRWLPVELLIRDRHDSASRAPGIRARVLMIVAADDEIVYRARSDALAQAFGPGSAQVELVAGARHNDLDSYPAYLQAVRGFLGDDAR